MTDADRKRELQALPAVGAVIERPAVKEAIREHGRAPALRAVREAIADARERVLAGETAQVTDSDVAARARRIARGTLAPVLNATGILVHTNLGRAPLAATALDAVRDVAAGYSTLEYDLDEGARGERHAHARDLLVDLTGAEDGLVVNNNAAAVLLALACLAAGREVVVSRGELVEIGGGFRIPEVLAQSGARLVEVGTTNRTHLRDYEQALGSDTALGLPSASRVALLLKVHRSNFAMVGFTAEVGVRELAALGRARGVLTVCDAGSGCLTADLAGKDEPTVRELVEGGADLVTFSGDKLLGGPQAGIVVGRARHVELLRRHPLMRALRPDKLCLAALLATLRLWRDDPASVPLMQLASIPAAELEQRCTRLAAAIGPSAQAVRTVARIGGGAAPLREIPSWGIALDIDDPDTFSARLRDGDPAIVGRIEAGALILDLRCVPAREDERIARAVSVAIDD
jgi:L-seryl-tRNA(Ser) seleniumtransferase